MLNRLRVQMAEHEVTIELSPEAKEMLVEKGYDPAMGARPLRRAIQRLIEDPLADFVLGRSLEPGSTIVVKRKNEEEVDIEVIPPIDSDPRHGRRAGEGRCDRLERRAGGRRAGRRPDQLASGGRLRVSDVRPGSLMRGTSARVLPAQVAVGVSAQLRPTPQSQLSARWRS